jgi:putative membrane protein
VRPRHLLIALVAATGAVLFIGLPHAQEAPPTWALLYGGALAVAVMLLPGISGSLLLVVLGQYTRVAGALHDGDWGALGVFLAGVALGAALFVPLLRYLLRRQHDVTMAALTGLMAGSLRALWPWKTNYDPKAGMLENAAVGGHLGGVVLCCALGFLAAWALARLERRFRAGRAP